MNYFAFVRSTFWHSEQVLCLSFCKLQTSVNFSFDIFLLFYLAGISGTVVINENGDRDSDMEVLNMVDPSTGTFKVVYLSHSIYIYIYS